MQSFPSPGSGVMPGDDCHTEPRCCRLSHPALCQWDTPDSCQPQIKAGLCGPPTSRVMKGRRVTFHRLARDRGPR